MQHQRPQYVVKDLSGLVAAMAHERKRLGFSQLAFDDRVGLTYGHTAKIEAGYRGLGPCTLPHMLDALGCVLVLAPSCSTPTPRHRRTDIPDQLPLPLPLVERAREARDRAPRRSKRNDR